MIIRTLTVGDPGALPGSGPRAPAMDQAVGAVSGRSKALIPQI